MLVALAIVAGIGLILAELFISTNKYFSIGIDKQERLITEKTIENYVLTLDALALSSKIPENESLKSCLLGVPKTACTTQCCSAVDTDFFIADPLDDIDNPTIEKAIAGTQKTPVLYSSDGVPGCTTNCKYRVTASFFPKCFGDLPQCDRAAFIKVILNSESTQDPPAFKKRTTEVTYYVKTNSKPYIETSLPNLTYPASQPRSSIDIVASTGDASEYQQLYYESCISTDPGVAKVTCYGFKNNFSKIYLDVISEGTTTIQLRVNDGQSENASGDLVTFNVNVTPATP